MSISEQNVLLPSTLKRSVTLARFGSEEVIQLCRKTVTLRSVLCLLYNGTVHYGSLIIDTKTVPFYKDLQKSIGKKRVRCSYSLLRPVISIEIRGTRLAWFSTGIVGQCFDVAGKDGIWTIASDSYAVKSGVNPSEKYVNNYTTCVFRLQR